MMTAEEYAHLAVRVGELLEIHNRTESQETALQFGLSMLKMYRGDNLAQHSDVANTLMELYEAAAYIWRMHRDQLAGTGLFLAALDKAADILGEDKHRPKRDEKEEVKLYVS